MFLLNIKKFIAPLSGAIFNKDQQHGKNTINIVGILLLIFITSCSRDIPPPTDVNVPPVLGEPLSKTQGKPQDDPFSAFIGAHGGLVTYDVHTQTGIRLEIPPAAVDQSTKVTIQPISNTHDETSGKIAFRLSPEGLQFKKPIKVSIQYDPEIDGNPQTRMVAFQRGDGVWCGVSTALDVSKQMLTIETTHFSDWVWFDFISIRNSRESVRKGEKVELKLLEQILGALNATNHIDSVPLAAMDEIGISKDLTVTNWKIVQGPGHLEPKLNTHALHGNAIYTAPDIIDNYTDVEVQVEIESKSGYISDRNAPNGRRRFEKLILLSKIQLIPDGSILLKLNGITQNLSQPGNAYIADGKIYIRAENEDQTTTLTLECLGSASGIYPGGDAEGQSQFLFATEYGGQRQFLNNFYRLCDNQFVYNGTTSIINTEDHVEGSFNGTLYPLYAQDCETPEPTAVEFQFKIKRTI